MAKPIEHSAVGAVATTGWKAGKWALIGVAVAAILPFALGAGTVAAVGALGLAHWGMAAVVGVLGAAATLASTAGWGALPWIAGGGAITGAFRGVSRVSAENAAFRNKVEGQTAILQNSREAEVNNAGIAAMQQGYMIGSQEGQEIGFKKGQEEILNRLRAAQEQMMRQHMGTQTPQAKGGFAAKLTEQREAQVAAGPQVAC